MHSPARGGPPPREQYPPTLLTTPVTDFTHPHIRDLQVEAPDVALDLEQVGVRSLVRGVIIGGQPATVTIDVGVFISAMQRGAHMSRFHEVIDAAVETPHARESLSSFAAALAHGAAAAQNSSRAHARVEATLVDTHPTPASGRISRDPYQAQVQVVVDGDGTQFTSSATVQGITACPCAQELVAHAARERLIDDGFDDAQIARILELVPVATHNQRGEATLSVCSSAPVDPAALAGIARGSMSARVHELLKRDDERAVVEQAHAHPQFVEDCVRDMIAGLLTSGLPLAPDDHITARQVNFESIHAHDAVAQHSGTVARLRAALDGSQPVSED